MLVKVIFFKNTNSNEINFPTFSQDEILDSKFMEKRYLPISKNLKLRKLYRVESPKETSTTSNWHFRVNEFPSSLGYVIHFGRVTLTRKTNMTIENPPFDDVFPIENGGCSNVI